MLRNDLELNGPKYGCGLGECGACAVLIDGVAARACVIPIEGCAGRDIVTLEGLGTREHPDPVQDAFIREQAAQCGYLTLKHISEPTIHLSNSKGDNSYMIPGGAGAFTNAFVVCPRRRFCYPPGAPHPPPPPRPHQP